MEEKEISTGQTSEVERNISMTSDFVEEHEEYESVPERISKPTLHRTISYASGAEGYADGRVGGLLSTERTRVSVGSLPAEHNLPEYEVDWDDEDPENPREWKMWRKACTIATMSYGTSTVVLYSTAYTSTIPGLQSAFGISDTTGILGLTTYLFGLATGSVINAPLSEMYGRRPIYIASLALFVLLVLPCALAPNIEAILITRFFGAFAASAMISNAPGTVNDVVLEKYRALAFSIWSIGPMNGPIFGPVIGGFSFQYLGWRWTNWIVMILSGVAFFFVALIPETYAPAILRKRAAAKRKATGDDQWWSRYDEALAFWPLLKVNLSRPFILMVTEVICIFWDIYIAIVYGILYLCFVAYPIVFTDLRGWSASITGLAFSGIGIGTMVTIACEPLLRRLINSHKKDPETGEVTAEAMVSVVCIAAVLLAAGELIFAWTCTPNVHWIWPILAGIPFGAGNGGVFIYASNYLVHSYSIYAASALAGNAVLRSILGATLPLAGPALYAKMGANWAGTFLGLLETLCVPIPVVFYLYGHKIRTKSVLITKMREDARRMEGDREKSQALRRASLDVIERAEAQAQGGGVLLTGSAVVEEAADIKREFDTL